MKKVNLKKIFGLLAILVCGLTVSLSLTSCDNDVLNEIFDDGVESWDDYVSIKITRCERVGHNLIIDYEMKNKKDREIGVSVYNPGAGYGNGLCYEAIVDNLGNKYFAGFSFASEDYAFYYVSGTHSYVNISAKNTVIGHIKIRNFDDSNKAQKVNWKMDIGIDGVNLDSEHRLFSQDGIKITDKRILKDGVQTNDNNLVYTIQSCRFNDNGNVILNFSVKNNTGYDLNNYELKINKVYDDMGNSYNALLSNSENSDYYSYQDWSISDGATINVSCAVRNVNKNAKNITVWLHNGIGNYIPTDDVVRFITIPIQK